ncbi:TadE/TadG family type IV pilus assembly protein [Janthinobacterium aquaticum]|uniref:TadE/TadG family type IV pilus assembly protein n=1 Tax=Janthinobacterium sp. FT58W TaxID=2654254 RepID=UPI001263EF54|nr:TadE family protein [Janthinobacterium sp. FT58W]KAB8040171.1 hypothetical protein GCM43_20375 [Janthinobacterium sp. FT58W]
MKAPSTRRQRGVAAIELALIMLFFTGLLPVVLLCGRALFAYTALQKSAHDAARYMATLPLPQMMNLASAAEGSVVVRQMVSDAMQDTWPEMETLRITVECVYADDAYQCGSYASRPLQVRLKLTIDMPVRFLPTLLAKWLPQMSKIALRANATLRYDN